MLLHALSLVLEDNNGSGRGPCQSKRTRSEPLLSPVMRLLVGGSEYNEHPEEGCYTISSF